jgi:alkyl sulfatase BDS1-like metallo-beta-lactamase superfamily hydrolase
MGWYDANPVHLTPLEPADEAARYVALMGGAKKVLAAAQAAFDGGDDRWAGELANRLVYADAKNAAARELLAKTYDRQAVAAESAIWRNMYLTGARELRNGVQAGPGQSASLDFIRNTPTPMLLDLLAVRLDPAKAQGGEATVDLVFPDRQERFRVRVKHDVLTYEADPKAGQADGVFAMPRTQFLTAALAGADLSGAATEGDRAALGKLLGWLSAPRAGFPIVTR